MEKLILSQIPINEFKELLREVVQEEISGIKGSESNPVALQKPITTKELCQHLNITEATLIRWRKKDKIPFFTIGSSVRFHLHKVLEALEKKK